MPLFSIIIPTYNSANTLAGCLDSVLSQTCQDIEILVQDGGSTDDTAAIVQALSERTPGLIRWVTSKDKGIYDAMNRAVERATGEWVYFLGSDDYLRDPQVLQDVAAVLTTSAADLVYGDAIVTSDNSRHGGVFDLRQLQMSHNMCHQTIFYRRRVFAIVGNYNLSYPIIADWDLNIRCFQHVDLKTQYIQRDIVLYNDETGVSSVSKNDPFYQLVPAFYIRQINELERQKRDLIYSREYKIGLSLYGFLKKTGILTLLKKLR